MRNSALDNTKFLALKIEEMIGYGAQSSDTVATNQTKAATLDIDKGQYLYATRCAACHTIGHGDKVGPDLLGVTNVRDLKWLRRIISEPDKLIDEKDPLAMALFTKYSQIRMPRLGLADLDVNTLIDYLKTQSASVVNRENVGSQK
jgi:protein SCO1/2